jgi:hypothetical protein
MKPGSAAVAAAVTASVAVATLAGALTASRSGAAGPPPSQIAHPSPVLANVRVDYEATLVGPSGAPATLRPLQQAVIAQALADYNYLAYQAQSDLGGFVPAQVGHFALSSGGRAIIGNTKHPAQIPHFAQAGGGQINSFAPSGTTTTPTTPPDNGKQPLPGVGVPPPTPTPGTTTTAVPPPNQGFGGTPTPTTTTTTAPATTAPATTRTAPTTTRKTTTTPTTTTATTSTSTTATTTTPTTTTTTTPTTTSPPHTTTSHTTTTTPTLASCGTAGLTITSDHSTCRIYATNMAPGGAASEVMTIRNDAGVAITVSLRAAGTQTTLWNDLELGVWQVGTAPPDPLPPLLWWTTQDNDLVTLQPGQSIRYEVELYLPSTAGNSDQDKSAVIDFIWKARA